MLRFLLAPLLGFFFLPALASADEVEECEIELHDGGAAGTIIVVIRLGAIRPPRR